VATPTTVPVDVASPTADASPSSVQAGGQTSVSGAGFTAGESLDLNLCSTPVFLGKTTADASGNFLVAVTIPTGTAPGTHTIVISNAGRSRIATAGITVVAGGGGGGNGGGTTTTGGGNALARTGAEFARMGWLAGLTLLLGLWLVRAARFERYAAPWTRRRWW